MNIIWQLVGGSIAITTIVEDGLDPVEHAQHMQDVGAIPKGSAVLATNYTGAIPAGPIESLAWNGSALVTKPAPAPAPAAAPASAPAAPTA